MFNSLISNGVYNIFSGMFNTTKEDNIIIDPMSCLIKLSILSFYNDGTKINVSNNKISFDEPTVFQGVFRYFKGDGREDLHNLNNPINKCKEWYWKNDDENIKFLFDAAVGGLKKLQATYSNNSTIHIVFDHYINLLKNTNTIEEKIIEKNVNNKINEIHRFLKELWSEHEINLIINLLKEFKGKYENSSKEVMIKQLNTINTITQTKEEELYSYIREHSTVL